MRRSKSFVRRLLSFTSSFSELSSPPIRTRVRIALAAVPALASLGLSACAVRTYPPRVGGYATVYASDVPPDIYSYPRAPFQDGYAYLVHDDWYYPSGGSWVVIQGEPVELHRYRGTYVNGAPPAYRGGYGGSRGYYEGHGSSYRQQAPPAYGYPPPAVRVR
ncbi:MAG: hypothetical protein M3O50_02900 [Myxococcota bacterium]|nr:hypothetical protein [Myxococcota bacterium]